MLKSINELASLVGADRLTVKRRADQLGLEAKDGKQGAMLYDSRALLQLVPPPYRSGTDATGLTREQAAARKDMALAEKTELEVARLKGRLADVDELLEAQNEFMDIVIGAIKSSSLTDDEKEDMLGMISKRAEFWRDA